MSSGLEGVAGVLVLYHPGGAERESVARAAGLLARVFVVDNSAPPAALAETPPGVRVIRNGANLGLACALNQGLEAAIAEGFAYALLLDQDSRIEAESIEKLLAAHAALDDAFITAPRIEYGAAAPGAGRAGGAPRRVNVAISAGSLVDLAHVPEVGLHDERLFVDGVDFEYCLRAAGRGYFTYRVPGAVLRQRLGERRPARFLGLRAHPTHHPPERRYYKVRNFLYLAARHARTHPRWAFHALRRLAVELVQIWLFEDRKRAKTRAYLAGARDFARRRYGARADGLAPGPGGAR